jgi:beta-lactamase regulating signal transducer with metallopeptidase domain/protocatechuate 3,4-dioxygenase beta subunit
MNETDLFLRQPWVARAGWTLVHFLWQGSAIAIALALVRAFIGRRLSARGRYALSCAALALMTAAPLFTFLAAGSVNASALPRPEWPLAAGAGWERALPWLVVAWLAGVVVFSARIAAGWRAASRLRRIAVGSVPGDWQEALVELIRRMRVSAPVRLLASSLAPAPAVVGWLRPVILMPVEAMAGLPIEQVRALLAHELAHILRQDYLVNILQSVSEALLFYHPAVWWVSSQIRAERELCCDDLAVEASGDALEYAIALADLETARRARLRAVMAANGGSLAHRIRRLAGKPESVSHNLPGPGAVWALTVLWLLGIGAVALHAGEAARPRAPHIALRRFAPSAVAPAPLVVVEPPVVKLSSVSSLVSTLLFDPFFAAPQPPLQQSATGQEKRATVSGTVTSTSGKPVANANVLLLRSSGAAGSSPGVFSVRSGDGGEFAFDKVDPGQYHLVVSHPKYISGQYSTGDSRFPVSLTEGQAVTGLAVKLSEASTVSGRVVDEDGDPFPHAKVMVLRSVHYYGRRTISAVSEANSGDDGKFEVAGVPPGRYYLRVAGQPSWTSSERAPVAAVKPGQKDMRPNSAYLGGTREPEGAAMIEVGVGQQMSMGDVRLFNDIYVHVRGKVIGDPATLEGARVMRMPREPTTGSPWSYGADIHKDGSFDLANMWSSKFAIAVVNQRGEYFGWIPITIPEEDMEGVVINAGAAPLSGVVRVEGREAAQAGAAPLPSFSLSFTAVGIPAFIRTTARVTPDGSFTVPRLAPGRWAVELEGLPAGSYVKSMRLGGVDVIGQGLQWVSAGALDVLVSPKAATLEGLVVDAEGKPAPSVAVTLVPEASRLATASGYPTTYADQQGRYRFSSLPPGKYKAYAWEEFGSTDHWDAAFMNPFEGRGESVEVSEAGHASAALKLITKTAKQELLKRAGQ